MCGQRAGRPPHPVERARRRRARLDLSTNPFNSVGSRDVSSDERPKELSWPPSISPPPCSPSSASWKQTTRRSGGMPTRIAIQTVVRDPALDFITDFGGRLQKLSPHFVADARTTGGSLMRPYRDTRFSNDKTPYKTNVGIQFRHEAGKDIHAPGLLPPFGGGRLLRRRRALASRDRGRSHPSPGDQRRDPPGGRPRPRARSSPRPGHSIRTRTRC